jgi:hypothetical protein
MSQDQSDSGFFWLFEQMMRLPVAAFVYTMEMLVKTMHGLQHMADFGAPGAANRAMPQHDQSLASGAPMAITSLDTAPRAQMNSQSQPGSAVNEGATTTHKETTKMPDTNLNDDMLKLVRYKVLFVKREYETAFPEQEDLVSDNMSASAFTAWKIAEFIQNIGDYPIPIKWKGRNYAGMGQAAKLTGLPEDDKKYLRVYYEVLERYPREKFKYEEQQIKVLEEIRDKMPAK